MGNFFRNHGRIHRQNINPINMQIILVLTYNQDEKRYKSHLTDLLKNYINLYAQYIKVDYKSIYVIYSGNIFYGDQLKKPISEIINLQHRNEGIMPLLVEKTIFDYIEEDEIIIILSIESVKRIELSGKKNEKIINIIRDSIKLDFNWVIFKYKDNEINIEQKFDDIADEEDKRLLKIVINVKYTIPLIVNLINEQNYIFKFQCLLGDEIYDKIKKIPFCSGRILSVYDYYLLIENKKFHFNYNTIFYELISEDKLFNTNEEINNTIQLSSDKLEKTNSNMIINHGNIMNHPKNIKKIEIIIKIIKKCCCIRYKSEIHDLLYIIGEIIIIIAFLGAWIYLTIIIFKKIF